MLVSAAAYGPSIVVFGLSRDFTPLAALAIGGDTNMVSVMISPTLVQLDTSADMPPPTCAVA